MTAPTSRLLTVLSLLQSRRHWPGPELAERLDVSHRTVRRDVDRLRELGYNIRATVGPDGGYHLDAGDELPPLLFDDDQVVALAVALQSATTSGAGLDEAALRALTTVRQVLPSRLRHRLDALTFTALPSGPGDMATRPVSPGVLIALSAAVRAREVLRFDYADGGRATDDAATSPRRVEPHHLVTVRGRWYLVAWDLERDGWRFFRADRISPRSPTGPRFARREVPGGDIAEYVSARFRGSVGVGRWPCLGKVVLHLPAREVMPFAGDGTVEDLGPDRCSLEAGSWSWVALAAALNRFDTRIDVIHPPELTLAFGVLAARNAATAAGRGTDHAPQRRGPDRHRGVPLRVVGDQEPP